MATSSLRSRVFFPKLGDDWDVTSRALSEDEEQEGEEEPTYAIYQSPCTYRASNDEFLPEQIDKFDVCDTTFYGGCLEEPPATDAADIVELEIAFDFELWHRRRSSASKTLQHLEAVILEHVASVLGLNDCDDSGRRRMESQHDLTDEELDLLVGISSNPEDFEDEDFGKFFLVLGQAISNGFF
jgi:hypothetical protein